MYKFSIQVDNDMNKIIQKEKYNIIIRNNANMLSIGEYLPKLANTVQIIKPEYDDVIDLEQRKYFDEIGMISKIETANSTTIFEKDYENRITCKYKVDSYGDEIPCSRCTYEYDEIRKTITENNAIFTKVYYVNTVDPLQPFYIVRTVEQSINGTNSIITYEDDGTNPIKIYDSLNSADLTNIMVILSNVCIYDSESDEIVFQSPFTNDFGDIEFIFDENDRIIKIENILDSKTFEYEEK